MNYWIHDKDGTKTDEGRDGIDPEKKQLVSKKFNDDLDEYWKKKKEEAAQPATEPAVKTAPTAPPATGK